MSAKEEVARYFEGSSEYPQFQASFMQGEINLTVRGTDETAVIKGLRDMIAEWNASEVEKEEKTEVAKTVYASKDSPSCPECGGGMIEKNGQYGRFWGCQRFPECRGIIKIKDKD